MTHSRMFLSTALSANDAFKMRYPRYLKGAILAALALTALFVWLWPGYEAKPYQLRKEEAFEYIVLEPPAPIEEPPIPQEVPRLPPEILPADKDDPNAVDTIPETMEFDWLNPVPAPPTRNGEGFVASSAPPVLQNHVKADYPEIARRAGLEGTVIIHALVDVHGRVDRAEVTQGVHPILDRAAQAAALRCKFTPGKQRAMAVPVWVAIPYRFRLD